VTQIGAGARCDGAFAGCGYRFYGGDCGRCEGVFAWCEQ